jgi:hypothetical protein
MSCTGQNAAVVGSPGVALFGRAWTSAMSAMEKNLMELRGAHWHSPFSKKLTRELLVKNSRTKNNF